MSPVTNTRVLFNSIPEGFPEPGKTIVTDKSQTIDPDTVALNGGILVKLLYVSVDPYQRSRMRDEKIEDYVPPFKLGEPIDNYAVGVVVRSEVKEFKEDAHVYGILPYVTYLVISPKDLSQLRVLDNKYNLPWSTFIGAAGMPGKTAYMAWKEFGHVKKGETAFISGGAGPVGSLAIQYAKRSGLRVIASAGSEEKVEFMKQCGADVAFNYKTVKTIDVLKREGGIDVYWDNVGGETLDAALATAKPGGRFIECGMISGYNTGGASIKNIWQVVANGLTIYGLNIFHIEAKYQEEFYEVVPKLIADGELKHKEQVYEGLEKTGDAISDVQRGRNKAKAVVKVVSE